VYRCVTDCYATGQRLFRTSPHTPSIISLTFCAQYIYMYIHVYIYIMGGRQDGGDETHTGNNVNRERITTTHTYERGYIYMYWRGGWKDRSGWRWTRQIYAEMARPFPHPLCFRSSSASRARVHLTRKLARMFESKRILKRETNLDFSRILLWRFWSKFALATKVCHIWEDPSFLKVWAPILEAL